MIGRREVNRGSGAVQVMLFLVYLGVFVLGDLQLLLYKASGLDASWPAMRQTYSVFDAFELGDLCDIIIPRGLPGSIAIATHLMQTFE